VLPVPEAGSLGISKSCPLDSEQYGAAKAVPSVRVSWMSETAILLSVLSALLSGHSFHAAFRCSASRAPSIFVHVARQPLSCPPRASEIGEAYLISPSAVLGVDSPHRRLLPFQYIGPNCFLQTGYLPVLADSVRAPTALFQVNLLALARLHCGVGDFHRALLLGSLFQCLVGIRPSSWPLHLYDWAFFKGLRFLLQIVTLC